MNEVLDIPTLQAVGAPTRRLTPLSVGQIWHVRFPYELELVCMQVDEVTKKTVSLRRVSDLGRMVAEPSEPAKRYDRRELVFVEQAPEVEEEKPDQEAVPEGA